MDKGALLLAASLLGVGAGITQLCSIAGRCRRSWCVCFSSPPADSLLVQSFTPSNPAAGAQRLSFPPAHAKLFFPPVSPPCPVELSFRRAATVGAAGERERAGDHPQTRDPASPLLRAMGQCIRRLPTHLREVIAYFQH